jgi:ATP-dependent RNA helicase DeaD
MPKPPKKTTERKPTEKKAPAKGAAAPRKPKTEDRPKPPKPEKVAPPAPEEEAAPPAPAELPSFAELGLAEPIVRAITELGFESPTPIQARAIPVLLSGRDMIGQAQTGTGKTAAFALPIIQRIDVSQRHTQAIILAPTRELAVQVAGGVYDLAKHTGLRVVPVYGGQPIDRQFRALREGAQVVVGTPGRVLDHLRRGSLTLERVAVCVLDEADEMLALGFMEDMEAILAELPEERQLAFFSATMPPRIAALTRQFLRDPEHVSIEAKRRTVETVDQTYYEVPRGKKLEALARVLDMETPGPTIVFCRTRQETNDLTEALRLRGYNAEALHGDMGQPERDRVMRRFREGNADLLVATDVAARGLDIETVTHVINYDIPWDVEQYIHRIGRTGRAGRTGDAITLVEGREHRQLKVIERMIGTSIKPARIPTAADIAARRRDLFKDALRESLEARAFDGQLATVEELCEDYDPAEVAAAALQMLWETQHSSAAETAEELAVDFEQPEAGMVRIFVGLGRQDGLRPADLVGAIVNEAGLVPKAIGVIDILDRTAFVEVPAAQSENVIEALRRTKLRNRKVKVQLARPGEVDAALGKKRPPRPYAR